MNGLLRAITITGFYLALCCSADATTTSQAGARTCIEDYVAGELETSTEPEVEALARSIWQTMQGERFVNSDITMLSCAYYRGRAEAFRSFIVYNPTWMREVIGEDRWQATVILAHELGHFAGNHPTSAAPRRQKELEADYFAGYFYARLGGQLDALTDVLSRLRTVQGSNDYPPRAEAIDSATRGYREGRRNLLTRFALIQRARNQNSVDVGGIAPTMTDELRAEYDHHIRAHPGVEPECRNVDNQVVPCPTGDRTPDPTGQCRPGYHPGRPLPNGRIPCVRN